MTTYEQDPQARLDYEIDWTNWLPEGDQLADSEWASSDESMVIENDTHTLTTTTAWIRFTEGVKPGSKFYATNHITTSDGREDDRMIAIKVKEH